MRYMDKRFNNMKKKANPFMMLFMMGIRLSLLVVILSGGKFACEWAVDQSHNTVSSTKLKRYTKIKLKEIRDLKINGSISDAQLKEKVNEIHTNTKQNYLKDKIYNDN